MESLAAPDFCVIEYKDRYPIIGLYLKGILKVILGLTLISLSAYMDWFVLRHAYRMFTDPVGSSFVLRLYYGPIKIVEPISSILAFSLSSCGLICGILFTLKKQNKPIFFIFGLLAISIIIIGFVGALL